MVLGCSEGCYLNLFNLCHLCDIVIGLGWPDPPFSPRKSPSLRSRQPGQIIGCSETQEYHPCRGWVFCGKTKGNSRLNRWTQIQKISVSTVLLEPVGTIQKGHSDTCSDSSGRNPMASVISVTILVWETLIFSSIGQVVFSFTRTDFTLLKCKWYKQNMYKYKAAIICNLDVQLYT